MKNCPICESEFTTPSKPLPAEIKDFSVSGQIFKILECKNCELLHTAIENNTTISEYYKTDDYVSHGLKLRNPVHLMYAIARKFTLKRKKKIVEKLTSGRSILDYGCGTGEFLEVMKQGGWKTTGYEPSPEALKATATKGLDSTTADAHSLKGDQSIITLWHVLEHTENPIETIVQLKKKLTDSGKIIIAVPNYKSHDASKYSHHWAGFDVPRHLWHFSWHSINALAQKTGLKVVDKLPMKLDAYYVSLLSEKYLNGNSQKISTYFSALLNGYTSNRLAGKTGEYSSMIYILAE